MAAWTSRYISAVWPWYKKLDTHTHTIFSNMIFFCFQPLSWLGPIHGKAQRLSRL